jgi:hypothetical protein
MIGLAESETSGFLRVAAAAMREIATRAPEIARELRDLAADLDEDATELAGSRELITRQTEPIRGVIRAARHGATQHR